jgi:plastocyanin
MNSLLSRRFATLLTLSTAAILLVSNAGGAAFAADAASVSIHNFSFDPASITVPVGGTVNWTNDQPGVTHTVTADDGSFDAGRLASGQSFSTTFSTPGTIAYHCNIHSSMHGAVTVVAADNPAPAPGANQGPAGRSVTFRAGYNMIGVPSGTTVNADSVLSFDTAANSYTQLGSGDSLNGGRGYWAYFSTDTTITLPAGSDSAVTVPASAGTWQMIGNPSGTTPALVTGADSVFAFDAAGGQYMAVTTLQPGQGAWALSRSGGSITSAPGATTPAPAVTAQPAPATNPAPQPVQTVTPVPPTSMPRPVPYPTYP